MLRSMTKKERQNHLIIGPSRRTRIAKGSGTSVAEINRLLKKFEKTRLMMKKMSKNKKYQQQLMGKAVAARPLHVVGAWVYCPSLIQLER